MGAGASTAVNALLDDTSSSSAIVVEGEGDATPAVIPKELARMHARLYADAAAFERAESEVQAGAEWTDSEWPATNAALGDLVAAKFAGASSEGPSSRGGTDDDAASTGSSVAWRWPEEFVDAAESGAPVLFEGDPAANDVLEGRLGDCFLIAAMSVIAASHPELIRRLFVREALEPGAPVGVRLFVDGQWQVVLVDQRVPVGPCGRPLFGRARQPNLLWVPLLEKAYAKVRGLCVVSCALRVVRCELCVVRRAL